MIVRLCSPSSSTHHSFFYPFHSHSVLSRRAVRTSFTLKLLFKSYLPECWRTTDTTLFVSQPTGHLAFLHTAFQKAYGWQGQKPSCAHPTGSILNQQQVYRVGTASLWAQKPATAGSQVPFPFQKHVMFEQPCGKNMPNFAWEFAWLPSLVTRGFCTLWSWLKGHGTCGSKGWHALLSGAGLVVVKQVCAAVVLDNV